MCKSVFFFCVPRSVHVVGFSYTCDDTYLSKHRWKNLTANFDFFLCVGRWLRWMLQIILCTFIRSRTPSHMTSVSLPQVRTVLKIHILCFISCAVYFLYNGIGNLQKNINQFDLSRVRRIFCTGVSLCFMHFRWKTKEHSHHWKSRPRGCKENGSVSQCE
jgi:hypothetical protein